MTSHPLETYDSTQARHPLLEELRSLIKYRELVYQFVARAIKTRYKRSALGVVWTLLNPLLNMLVLTVVFSAIFRFQIENYPVYVLSGQLVWLFLSSTTTAAMQEMAASGPLLGRIYVPKSVFAVSGIGMGLYNLGISLIPLFAIALILGVPITPAVLVMPLAVALLAVFCLGFGLLLSAAAVFFADMIPVYEVALTVWFYATPIFYPLEFIEQRSLAWVFKLNPMYHFVRLFREPLLNGVVPEWQTWAVAGGFALAAFILGSWVFTSKSSEYAYRV